MTAAVGSPRVLLDTHALVWALTEPARLSNNARAVIASSGTALFVSAASAWEIATKHRLGKFPEADALILGYGEHLRRLGAAALPVTSRHALAAGSLTWSHRDPFDRMLAAQSVLESLPLITVDAAFDDCVGVRVVW